MTAMPGFFDDLPMDPGLPPPPEPAELPESVEDSVTDDRPEEEKDLDPRARQDFEGLLYLGYLEEECEVAGHHFLLRTPTQDERIEMGLIHRAYINSFVVESAWELLMVAMYCQRIDSRDAPEPLTERARNPVATRFEWIKRSIRSSVVITKVFNHCVLLEKREKDLVDYLDGQTKS